MTTYQQFEANRRNALKSTGPKTETGKQVSRRNAVRHGLTAETVIGALEDAEDYKALEEAITADYDAQSAVERELVLRLASLLWRLRRATTMETGLFAIEADHRDGNGQIRPLPPSSSAVIHARFRVHDLSATAAQYRLPAVRGAKESADPTIAFARCFLGLANQPNFALDRLSRYEARLWRQASRLLTALDRLDRRKPHERGCRFRFDGRSEFT
jgi:hypothetical protein